MSKSICLRNLALLLAAALTFLLAVGARACGTCDALDGRNESGGPVITDRKTTLEGRAEFVRAEEEMARGPAVARIADNNWRRAYEAGRLAYVEGRYRTAVSKFKLAVNLSEGFAVSDRRRQVSLEGLRLAESRIGRTGGFITSTNLSSIPPDKDEGRRHDCPDPRLVKVTMHCMLGLTEKDFPTGVYRNDHGHEEGITLVGGHGWFCKSCRRTLNWQESPIPTLRRQLERNQRDPFVMRYLADLLPSHIRSGRRLEVNSEREQLLRKALSIEPGDPCILSSLGNFLFSLGRTQEARNLFEAATRISSSRGNGHRQLVMPITDYKESHRMVMPENGSLRKANSTDTGGARYAYGDSLARFKEVCSSEREPLESIIFRRECQEEGME